MAVDPTTPLDVLFQRQANGPGAPPSAMPLIQPRAPAPDQGQTPPPAPPSKGPALVQNLTIPAAGRALLATIGSPSFESNGSYTQRFNQPDFSDFSQHPGTYGKIAGGPNRGSRSNAAGRYQFLSTTWKDQADKLGLKDFSPANQDAAAWNLAKETYAGKYRGRDLEADLHNPQRMTQVIGALKSQWSSLPGGIENRAGFRKFSEGYGANLQQEVARGPSVTPTPVASAWDPQGAAWAASQRLARAAAPVPATAPTAVPPPPPGAAIASARTPLYDNSTSP